MTEQATPTIAVVQPLAMLIHGFNSHDNGKHTTDQLRPYFEAANFTVKELDYSWLGLIGVSACDKKMAQIIADMLPQDVIGIGHSNGCSILRDASLCGAKFEQLVFINPALERDATIGQYVKRIHVWHSPSDWLVKIARFAAPGEWGDMGAKGYTGSDPRFINYNKEIIPPYSTSHSDVFGIKLRIFGPMIVSNVVKYLP